MMLVIIGSLLFLVVISVFLAVTSLLKLHLDNFRYCKEEASAKCNIEDYNYCETINK